MERQVLLNKKVDIEEISHQLNVSQMTIRRDLKELESEGKVIRTHGGAISPKSLTEEMSYSSKKSQHNAQKKALAKQAVTLIEEGSTIILDSGTTTLELAKLLKLRSDLTVVTNDIKIANELLDSPLKVIVTGGELQKGVGALYGSATQQMLNVIHADIFFLGAHAIDKDNGVTAPTFEKSLIKQMMIKAAERTWLLADHSKFDNKAFANVCALSQLEGLITDDQIEGEILRDYESKISIWVGGD
ncbi:DeoR/GlpR family DNA-binding transcription regulator [Thalassobacillus sp. CUG 92003]|uniref:DeoR/GlpR family DNA-binding transcription regulator n=1 Tax=Thalassobacillus sp. CUG 92003 TaxID=2736641 RepID=UPI00351AA8A7